MGDKIDFPIGLERTITKSSARCIHCNCEGKDHVPSTRPDSDMQYLICPIGLKLDTENNPNMEPIRDSVGNLITNPLSGRPLAFVAKVKEEIEGDVIEEIYLLTVFQPSTIVTLK